MEAFHGETGLRRVRLASESASVKCPSPPPHGHPKALVSIRPLRPMVHAACSGLCSCPPSTPHQPSPPSALQEVDLLQAGPWGQEPNLACAQAQGRPVPRPSRCALFPEHSPPLPRLQASPSSGLSLVHGSKRKGPTCTVTPFMTPDTTWGSPALLRKTSRTLWKARHVPTQTLH